MVNPSSNISTYVESIYDSLTKSEKLIADYVLKEPEKIIYSSITDLANEVGVGEATVFRFCRKIGFKSYQTFKMALGQDITNSTHTMLSELDVEIKNDDSLQDMVEKTLNINLCALRETLSLLDLNEVKKAYEAMLSAKRIFFCGLGVSGITAQDAVCKFMRIGLNAYTSIDLHFLRMQAALLGPEDVIVGISYSGNTKDLYDVLAIGKETGAKVISITHQAKSSITKISDIVLLHGSKVNLLQGGALSTKISQLMVIDILYNAIIMKLGDVALKNKKHTFNAILEKFI